MPTSSDDLSNYLPDPATAEATADEAANFRKEISRPELVERLARLKTDPDLGKAAQTAIESVQGYVPPTELPESSDPTLPYARVKVATAAAPQRPQELPTMPSLKRLEGEQVAVEVGARRAPAKVPPRSWLARVQPSSPRSMILAVLAVMVPLILVILLFVKPQQDPREHGGTAPTAPSATGAMTATAPAVGTAVPAVTSAPVPTPVPSASSAAPAAAPPTKPSGKAAKQKTPPASSVTTSGSAAPAAAPSETPSAAPAPPASTSSKWF